MFRKIMLMFLLMTACQISLADQQFDDAMARAKAGDASAQTNLGLMYIDGKGVPQDYQQAVTWFTKAAEQGHASAQSY